MKRYLYLMILIIFIICPFVQEAQATEDQSDITVTLDGLYLQTDVAPVIINERTLVPVRTVAEALHLKVNWNEPLQEVVLEGKDLLIKMKIGVNQAFKNDSMLMLEAPPLIKDNRTMLPIRFVSEALGCKVVWEEANRRISISTPPVELKLLGYYALGDPEASSSWTDLFTVPYPQTRLGNTDLIDEIALGWYSLDEQGNLLTDSDSGWKRPDGWSEVITAASQYKNETQMCVQMTDENARIRKMINDNPSRSRAINNLVNEADKYDGVNLDFEGLGWNDTPTELSKVRADFTRFVSDLAGPLHAAGKTLTLSLHPPNSEYPGYDYTSLGTFADSIVIMAYDYGPKPEPLSKVEQAVKQSLSGVPAQKLFLGISVVSESDTSIVSKIELAKNYRLGGIALWRLGLISDEEWAVLRTHAAVDLGKGTINP